MMTMEKFNYSEDDYVTLPIAAKYLEERYGIKYGVLRAAVIDRKEIEYKRLGRQIRLQWGKLLEWEKKHTIPAVEKKKEK